MKKAIISILIWFVCMPCLAAAEASKELEEAIEKAKIETSMLFDTNDTEAYSNSVHKLMDLCLKANDEELYYKSWSNLATFIFRTNAQKGLKVTDEMREYAKEHDSKYGIVTALYTQANLSVKVDMIDRAVKLCQQAIEYKNQYLPEVNCTHIYWMLARIHLVKFQREEALDALEKCQQEPDLTPNQQMYILAYKCEEIDSIKNRLLLIYTDGLNEAENPQQEQFGDDRLLEVLRRTNFDNARQVIESLKQEVETYRNGAEPNDDFTMMCLNVS